VEATAAIQDDIYDEIKNTLNSAFPCPT